MTLSKNWFLTHKPECPNDSRCHYNPIHTFEGADHARYIPGGGSDRRLEDAASDARNAARKVWSQYR